MTPEQLAELEAMKRETSDETLGRWKAAKQAATKACRHSSYSLSSDCTECLDCGAHMVAAIWATGHGDLVIGEPLG